MKLKAALKAMALAACLTSCSKYTYHEDNLIEEIVEEGIKHHTGTEIDLSPGKKETGFTPRAFVPVSKKRKN